MPTSTVALGAIAAGFRALALAGRPTGRIGGARVIATRLGSAPRERIAHAIPLFAVLRRILRHLDFGVLAAPGNRGGQRTRPPVDRRDHRAESSTVD
ncbi:hypothetical protein [Amycolatopsis sp. TNS106]|uniref:hypothetical protein n=1 Tax=Amycolatopsis sp. TNS106 TaxID=2861750 RepID=UPI001C577ED8|nr:hypothetical protein [Amycolatopsis sp. TNS106]QXV59419.1 hypothetical protein CVV72_22020 [Amycolatopsis sp. TNS106]